MNPSTNISCPATGQVSIGGKEDHVTCYAPYVEGEAGVNVTETLDTCCGSEPIVAFDRAFGYRCYYYCNATSLNNSDPDTALAFASLQHCINSSPENSNGTIRNLHGIECYAREDPNDNRGVGGPPPPNVCLVGLCLLALMIYRMV